jgi:hypothetical protein
LRAVFEGDTNIAASILAKYRRIDLGKAASTIAALASGGKEERDIMTHIIIRLCETDPLTALSLFLTVFKLEEQGLCDTAVSTRNASGSATA